MAGYTYDKDIMENWPMLEDGSEEADYWKLPVVVRHLRHVLNQVDDNKFKNILTTEFEQNTVRDFLQKIISDSEDYFREVEHTNIFGPPGSQSPNDYEPLCFIRDRQNEEAIVNNEIKKQEMEMETKIEVNEEKQ